MFRLCDERRDVAAPRELPLGQRRLVADGGDSLERLRAVERIRAGQKAVPRHRVRERTQWCDRDQPTRELVLDQRLTAADVADLLGNLKLGKDDSANGDEQRHDRPPNPVTNGEDETPSASP